jgi:flagellar motor switch/type III secretory pathway protein FliN
MGGAGLGFGSPPLPFPWSSLEPVTRIEVDTLRAAKHWVAEHLGPARLRDTLEGLLGTTVAVRVRRTGPAASAPAFDGGTAVFLGPVGSTVDEGVLLELEGALANVLIAHALRRPAPVLVKPAVVSESTAGAVAAILAAGARRTRAGTALEVRRRSPAAQLEAELRPSSADALAVTLTVLVGDEAFAARAIFARRALQSASGGGVAPWTTQALAALGATPLRIPIVACTVPLTLADVAALGPGDVLVPGNWPLVAGVSGLTGRVLLASPASDVGICADLVDGPRLVLRGHREPLCSAEGEMTDEAGQRALIEAIGEVPVIVRVEVGEAALSARDWASLTPGDVVGLGRRVGEQVVLRIGGVPVARGELVDIEGEVGVRIVTRLAEETTAG